MAVILSKGIKVSHLFDSKVFHVQFDFDEWPSTHTNDTEVVKPYDGTFFLLRNKFKEVFPEETFHKTEAKVVNGNLVEYEDVSKVKSINYTINFLCSTGFFIMDEHVHGKEHA